MNKMNHFVPHLYSEKRQNEQIESFCPPPLFRKDKMTKCHLVPPSSIALELILEKIWKRVVKKKLWKKPGKKLILPWSVKNEEKKLKKANVQNLQIGLLLSKHQ